MKSKGILILSHVGFSFVDQLANQIGAEGVERFILSSLPEPKHQDRLPLLERMGEWFGSTLQHELSWDDVLHAINKIQAENKMIVACICVWEGYRQLMARANEYLGVKDIASNSIQLLTNKYELRKTLHQHKLSKVLVEPLTKENFLRYQQIGVNKFIKPRRGIASYGTFKLTPEIAWDDLCILRKELNEDTVFKGIFSDDESFIIEDFINGSEYSFEVLMQDGKQTIVAIHEKSEVSLEKMTTLENACVCPPINLTSRDIDRASVWLEKIFSMLGVTEGCFHVEAKLDDADWEIIEINPRVGGSLISKSVEHFTNGYSLLNLWIKLILQGHRKDIEFSRLLNDLRVTGSCPAPMGKAAFFRVFFGEVGTIESIEESVCETSPLVSQIFVKPGDVFSVAGKENFVGQAMWALDYKCLKESYFAISKQSEFLYKLQYKNNCSGSEKHAALLIVDFNLSRRDDVAYIRSYSATKYLMRTVLIRANPSDIDRQLVDYIIDLNPLEENFVAKAVAQLNDLPVHIFAGVVFSDDAVHAGAQLLAKMNLCCDSSVLSENAYCKYLYRVKEQQFKDVLEAQQMFVPNVKKINTIACLESFICENKDGIVIKPTKEGNNRGVILLDKPTSEDVKVALEEVERYIKGGLIAEQLIPFKKEFSYDGIGNAGFVTEKFTASGRYPVEYGQLVPADITPDQASMIARAGRIANMIVGQNFGPFHNEIRLSDDSSRAAVVEANRRPAGMKIWSLAKEVFDVDLYAQWVDSVVQNKRVNISFEPKGSAMSIMLPASESGFVSDIISDIDYMFDQLQVSFALQYPQNVDNLKWLSCDAIASKQKYVHVPPRDNSDFIALVAVSASCSSNAMKGYLPTIYACWGNVLNNYLVANQKTVA